MYESVTFADHNKVNQTEDLKSSFSYKRIDCLFTKPLHSLYTFADNRHI